MPKQDWRELDLWWAYERGYSKQRKIRMRNLICRLFLAYGLMVAAVFAYELGVIPRLVSIVLVIPFFIFACQFIVRAARRFRARDLFWDAFERRWHGVPWKLASRARELSDEPFPEPELWAIECYEAHMSGDCLLCGAV